MSTFIKTEQERLEKKVIEILKRGNLRSYEDINIAQSRRETFTRCMNHVYLQKAHNLEKNIEYLKRKHNLTTGYFFVHVKDQTGYDYIKNRKFPATYRLSKPYPDRIFFVGFLVAMSFNVEIIDLLDKNIEMLDSRKLLRPMF